MSARTMFVFLLTVSLTAIVGIIYLAATLYFQGYSIVAMLLILTTVVLIWQVSFFLIKFYHDLKSGMPIRDERTKKVRMYAAGYAYFISLYIWLILLMFHKYLEYDDTLILGLIGMGLSFGLSWLFVSQRKGIE